MAFRVEIRVAGRFGYFGEGRTFEQALLTALQEWHDAEVRNGEHHEAAADEVEEEAVEPGRRAVDAFDSNMAAMRAKAGLPVRGVDVDPRANRFLVGRQGVNVSVLALGVVLAPDDARNLAAWLCALAFDGPEEAAEAIVAVFNT